MTHPTTIRPYIVNSLRKRRWLILFWLLLAAVALPLLGVPMLTTAAALPVVLAGTVAYIAYGSYLRHRSRF